MPGFTRNHYVPQWFQYRFLPPGQKGSKFFYLDLHPEVRVSNGHRYKRNSLMRWGPPRCFCLDDLYTTALGDWKSTEIEEKFFGPIDSRGKAAVEYFSTFTHPSADGGQFHAMLPYMSIQKIRTPKGLAYLAAITRSAHKNEVLMRMQELQRMFCAIWTECVWSIADASNASTKFILSDHPITVYNNACFPASKHCRGYHDPEIWLTGTHTLFPLSLDKVLILTNLSWVRDPYGNPLKERPNSNLFRSAMFKFTDIQTGRLLTDQEVNQINFIIKSRAHRYIAAGKKEWLFPEEYIGNTRWDQLGDGYLLMPDPRSVSFGGEIIIGYENRRSDVFDEYGRRPGQHGFKDEQRRSKEWDTHLAFQGEFARVFGPKRRGMGFEFGAKHDDTDSPDFHKYHLSLERLKPKHARKKARKR